MTLRIWVYINEMTSLLLRYCPIDKSDLYLKENEQIFL